MRRLILSIFLGCTMFAFAAADVSDKVDQAPSYYKCPFSMFDVGQPATLQNGGTWYCDVDGAQCPKWYFCSYGYPDGRSVCCHILGV